MELLDLEYRVVEDLIECGTIGLSSTTITQDRELICGTPPQFH